MPESLLSVSDLKTQCSEIDGRGYASYRSLERKKFQLTPSMVLHCVRSQRDPFASPSKFEVFYRGGTSWFEFFGTEDEDAERAGCDFLQRIWSRALKRASQTSGSGKGGRFFMPEPSAAVLFRSGVELVESDTLRLRLRVGLPAAGRRVLGQQAYRMLGEILPEALENALVDIETDLKEHVAAVRLQVHLRNQLKAKGWLAWIGDGAMLARVSGADEKPMPDGLRWSSEHTQSAPLLDLEGQPMFGTPIAQGVTLLVGGGFHGKSTVLKAIEQGIYDHIPGDGREWVVADDALMAVRAEDGRCIASTDLRGFLGTLPRGRHSSTFRTQNASGSTSQAAAIVEAVELGASALLIDEDTSATNVLVRDATMRALIGNEDEPIQPFVQSCRSLFETQGVSTVLVVGALSHYLPIADTVLCLRSYVPYDVTTKARELLQNVPHVSEKKAWRATASRKIDTPKLHAYLDGVKIKVDAVDRLRVGHQHLLLHALTEIREIEQTRTLEGLLRWAGSEQGKVNAANALWSHRVRKATEACIQSRFKTLIALGCWELSEVRWLALGGLLARLNGTPIENGVEDTAS